MRLFIAEKPSVAKAIAQELGITRKEDGFFCGNGNPASDHLKGAATPSSPFDCHLCHQKLIKRKDQKDYWWACSAYPSCKQTYSDVKGTPQYTHKKEKTHA